MLITSKALYTGIRAEIHIINRCITPGAILYVVEKMPVLFGDASSTGRQSLLCCKPTVFRTFFILFLFNFTIVKLKRKQALLRSNLSAISFMDALHFGKGKTFPFFINAGFLYG